MLAVLVFDRRKLSMGSMTLSVNLLQCEEVKSQARSEGVRYCQGRDKLKFQRLVRPTLGRRSEVKWLLFVQNRSTAR